LADAFETLLGDAQMRQQFGSRGKAFIEEHFQQDPCVSRVEDFFCSIAGQKPFNLNAAPQTPCVQLEEAQPDEVPEAGKIAPEASHTQAKEPKVLLPAEKPLRVAQIIAPSKISGTERLTLELCRRLTKLGHNVHLIVKANSPLLEVARAEGVESSSESFNGKLNMLAVSRLSRSLRLHRVDLVATHLSTASLWGSLAARSLGLPCVATVHALNTKTCYVYADCIIAVSQAVKTHLVDQGIPAERLRVVYNGIDLSRFEPLGNASELEEKKRALGFKPAAPLVGVVAHLTRKKGHSWFLEAAAKVAQQRPDVQFVLSVRGQSGPHSKPKRGIWALKSTCALPVFNRTSCPGWQHLIFSFAAHSQRRFRSSFGRGRCDGKTGHCHADWRHRRSGGRWRNRAVGGPSRCRSSIRRS
jgi:hypothetical protein